MLTRGPLCLSPGFALFHPCVAAKAHVAVMTGRIDVSLTGRSGATISYLMVPGKGRTTTLCAHAVHADFCKVRPNTKDVIRATWSGSPSIATRLKAIRPKMTQDPDICRDQNKIVMFKTNAGTKDRAVRIIAGAARLAWFFFDNGMGFWHYAKLIGVLPALTGLVGTCPLYSLPGVSTCPMKTAC